MYEMGAITLGLEYQEQVKRQLIERLDLQQSLLLQQKSLLIIEDMQMEQILGLIVLLIWLHNFQEFNYRIIEEP
tara:strand:+ start:557 stop:778 length:222 start_codon:yes stop_codon:yes gene_type:complete